MKVFGIDPGNITAGYGCIELCGNNEVRCIASGIVKPGGSSPEGLRKLFDEIERLIADNSPDLVAVEDIFFAKNVKSALKLGQARGVVLCAAARNNVEVVEISPTEVKQAATGNGRAEKMQVQTMISRIVGKCDFKTEDESDALAIAYAAAIRMATRTRLAECSS